MATDEAQECVQIQPNEPVVDKEEQYNDTGFITTRPSFVMMTVLVLLRTCCWYVVVGAWFFKEELVVFIPLAGFYWSVTDGRSVIGYIESYFMGIPVIQSPSHRTVHGYLWAFMIVYFIHKFIL